MNSGAILLLVLGRVDFCLGTSGVSASRDQSFWNDPC